MPYTMQHKAETRARIVRSALSLFVRHGFETVTIDTIMAEAGLTRGGFYNHFATKEELYAEAVESFGQCGPPQDMVEAARAGTQPEALAAMMIDGYLSQNHLDGSDGHCPLMALPSDTARGGQAVRRAYTDLLRNMIGILEAAMNSKGSEVRPRALAIATLCVGGMALARAVDDPALGTEIRAAARSAALAIGGFPDPAAPPASEAPAAA